MRKLLIGFLVIGTCGIANSTPISDTPTSTSHSVLSSTEKTANETHLVEAEKKGEKEIAATTPSTIAKLPEYPKSVNEDHSNKGLDVTVTTANKNEASTSHHKEEPIVTPSSNKAELIESTTSSLNHKGEPIASSLSNHKQEETTTISSGHKLESTNPSAIGQKGPTTLKPLSGDKEKKPNNNQKATKTSTAFLDKGKVVIFNGICGPDGCEIEGDIYDELVPLPHTKKQG